MRILTVLLLLTAFSIPAFAQNQSEYKIAAIRDGYMIIGQKPYKMLGDCPSFQPGDEITFSEDPITCDKVTAIDTDGLTTCELDCLENLGTPEPN